MSVSGRGVPPDPGEPHMNPPLQRETALHRALPALAPAARALELPVWLGGDSGGFGVTAREEYVEPFVEVPGALVTE